MLLRSGKRLPPRQPLAKKAPFKKLKKAVNKLKKEVKVQQRVALNTTSAVNMLQAGSFYLVNHMQTGDIDGTRDSTEIRMNNLEVAIRVYADETKTVATDQAITFRCMLVYDKQANKAIFTLPNLLSTGGTASRNLFAPSNFQYRKQFKIMYDRTFRIQPSADTRGAVGLTIAEFPTKVIKMRRKINLPTSYIAGAGSDDITDVIKGSLYFVIISEQDADYWKHDIITKLTYDP